ncbi:MAG: RNA polymerase sigma factor [Fimbriimonadaceae bacterium]
MKTLTLTWGSEASLIKKASRGDKMAFDEIVYRYESALYAMAYRILRNPEDAVDAVQETFIKAYKAIGAFDSQRPIKPWLCRICGNCCIDIVRGRKERSESLDQHEYMLVDQASSPDQVAADGDRDQAIANAIDRLPPRYREIVVMRHYRQMEVSEISNALGTPEGTVKSWLFRARRQLRQELTPVMS